MAKDSIYNKDVADYAVNFIECLSHTKGKWSGKPFELIDWQEQIIRDVFGTIKPNGYRQFNTAYIEIPKKQGKSELAAAVALLAAAVAFWLAVAVSLATEGGANSSGNRPVLGSSRGTSPYSIVIKLQSGDVTHDP